jgi:hypothetical protein
MVDVRRLGLPVILFSVLVWVFLKSASQEQFSKETEMVLGE